MTDDTNSNTNDTEPPTWRQIQGSDDQRGIDSERLRRAAKATGTLCLVLALLPFLVFAVPQTVGADHGFVILSGSMEPALSPGDVVIVSDAASVAVGDIITFSNGGSIPVTHRVVGVQDGQYITKGDANGNPDTAPVAPGSVLGRVVHTIPLIGYVIIWANTPTGQIALVLVPLLLLGVSSLRRWATEDGDSMSDETPNDGTDIAAMFDAVATDSEAGAELVEWTPPVTVSGPTARAAEPAAVENDAATDDTVGVPAPDLKLTLLSTAVLCGYAGWNVSREVATTGVPHPVSVGIVTAGLLGLAFALWATLSVDPTGPEAAEEAAPTAPEPTAVDGGVEMEDGT